jgi:hypothetical protein
MPKSAWTENRQLSLNVSKLDFQNKRLKLSHAVQNPHQPPLVSPVHNHLRAVNNLIQDAFQSLEEDNELLYNSSPLFEPKYHFEKHESAKIIRCLFRSLQVQEEKLSLTALKLFDLFLEKNIPEINDYLFMNSI